MGIGTIGRGLACCIGVPAATTYAHAKVRAGVADSLQAAAATQQASADAPVAPAVTEDLQDGQLTINGVRFIVRSMPDAECDYQSYMLAPDLGVLWRSTRCFRRIRVHSRWRPIFDHWIETVKPHQALERQDYQIILTGHGWPTDFGAIPGNIRYLETAREAFAKANTTPDHAGRLKAAFPDYPQ